MNKLLRANMVRLWKNKTFWFCFLVMAAFGMLERIGIFLSEGGDGSLDEAFWIGALVMGFVLSVFVSLFVGTEHEAGTIRNKVISGHTRSDIYLANTILCILAGWFMCFGCMAVSLVVGIPLLGFFQTPLPTVFFQGICVFALSAAYAAIFSLIAMLSRNRAVTSVICVSLAFLLLFLGAAISNRLEQEEAYYIPNHELGPYETADEQNAELVSNPNYISGAERNVYEIAFHILPGGQSLQLSGMLDDSQRYIELFLSSLAWVILSCSCGMVFFQKTDLK